MNCKYCGGDIEMENKHNLCISHLMNVIEMQCANDELEKILEKNPSLEEEIILEINNAKNCLERAIELIRK